MGLKRAEELGTWDGDKFVYHTPIEVGGRVIRAIRIPDDAEIQAGITVSDIIEALANSIEPEGLPEEPGPQPSVA